jgi:hypothetical protein
VILLDIRRRLNTRVAAKYKSVRQLMSAFDRDGDGVINKSDWMWGLKEQNFDLSEDEVLAAAIAATVVADVVEASVVL